jgi:uncharacterized DUF497 family protein
MSMKLEWDEAKNEANFHKHGIYFEAAAEVFSNPPNLRPRAAKSRIYKHDANAAWDL